MARILASKLQSFQHPTRHTMTSTQPFNPDKKFVRIIQVHPTGLVEFEFAVGEPELFVELLMAQAAFDEFCTMHGVTPTAGRLAQVPTRIPRNGIGACAPPASSKFATTTKAENSPTT